MLCSLLFEGLFNVTELCRILGAAQSTVSRNLRILVDAGLLSARRDGRLVYYGWRPDLTLAEEGLRRWLMQHGPELGGDVRRRAEEVWNERRTRTSAFFASVDPRSNAAAWMGSPDCLPQLLDQVPSSGTILDLGTGTGRLLEDLCDRADAVIAVDASPQMLEEARRRMADVGQDTVDFRLGDLSHLPLQDGEVDAVVANMVLHHAPEPARAVLEIHRVLRPGGTLLLGDFLSHDEEWMRESFADQWLGFSFSDISHWFADAGFESVALEPIPSKKEGAPSVFVARATRKENSPLNPSWS